MAAILGISAALQRGRRGAGSGDAFSEGRHPDPSTFSLVLLPSHGGVKWILT
jgi:hypothetical protein